MSSKMKPKSANMGSKLLPGGLWAVFEGPLGGLWAAFGCQSRFWIDFGVYVGSLFGFKIG